MIVAIVNPHSAGGKTYKEWPELQTLLETDLGELDVLLTETRLHAVELTRQALKSGADTVIAVGGDGMLNEVVNGFFENGCALNCSAKLAFIPRGTGSDFVRSWGAPASIREVADAIKTHVSQTCDVIRIHLNPVDGAPNERFCINMADVGIGGIVVDMVNRRSKMLGGTISFLWAGIQAALTHKNFPLHIELDGTVIKKNMPHFLVAIANGSYFGGGMHLAPQARPNDGVFDMVLVGDLTLLEKVEFAIKLYKGKIGNLSKIHFLQGTRVKIISPVDVLIDADGEFVGMTNATFEILPSAIQLIKYGNVNV